METIDFLDGPAVLIQIGFALSGLAFVLATVYLTHFFVRKYLYKKREQINTNMKKAGSWMEKNHSNQVIFIIKNLEKLLSEMEEKTELHKVGELFIWFDIVEKRLSLVLYIQGILSRIKVFIDEDKTNAVDIESITNEYNQLMGCSWEGVDYDFMLHKYCLQVTDLYKKIIKVEFEDELIKV